MSLDENKYRLLLNMGFSHPASVLLADDTSNEMGLEGLSAKEIADAIGNPSHPVGAKLSATFARRRFESINTRAAGVVVFTWDDGYPEWDQMIDLATSLGQRHTLCVTSDRINTPTGISAATIAKAAAAGHEIAAHSKTHTKINSTLLTAAQRLTEYEAPRTAIEAIIGAGKVRTWVYPFGTASSPAGRDATTDQEIYLRYDRQLDTAGGTLGVMPLGAAPRFTIPRVAWSPYGATDTTPQIKELIRRAASSPIVVPIYSHDFATGSGWANVQDVLNYAAQLGVPCITSAEAFPAAPFTLPDPSFEGSTVTWIKSLDTVGTIDHATVTPDVNIAGSKALAITSTDAVHSPFAYIDWPMDGGKAITISGRIRVSDGAVLGTAPAASVYVRFEYFKWDGSSAGAAGQSANLGTGNTWTRFVHAHATPAGTESVRIKLVALGVQGTVYFDHVHFGETALGVYG